MLNSLVSGLGGLGLFTLDAFWWGPKDEEDEEGLILMESNCASKFCAFAKLQVHKTEIKNKPNLNLSCIIDTLLKITR